MGKSKLTQIISAVAVLAGGACSEPEDRMPEKETTLADPPSGSRPEPSPPAKPGRQREPDNESPAGKLSVMTIGKADCRVTVCGKEIGLVPFFKKRTPLGDCQMLVACGDGSTYRKAIHFEDGTHVKIIVKEEMWERRK